MRQLSVENVINVFNTQAKMLSSILSNLGISFELRKIRTRSEECDDCIEFIYVMSFRNHELYEEFVKRIKGAVYG